MTAPAGIRITVAAADDIGRIAADAVLSALPTGRACLGVATGQTPLQLYAELARRTRSGDLDLSGAALVALDEYVGLGGDDPRSYAAYVRERIAVPLGVAQANVLVPDGLALDPDREAADVERSIVELGGVDVQIAGLGANGHLGFNEPGSAFDSLTRRVQLSERTRHDNARFFDGDLERVPRYAITQGLGTILRARSIVLLVSGAHKAAALRAALYGPVDPEVPASVLQRHPAVTVIADPDAVGRG